MRCWVLFGKPRDHAELEVYNDYNQDLSNLFLCTRDKPISLLKELGFLPLNSRSEFLVLRQFLARFLFCHIVGLMLQNPYSLPQCLPISWMPPKSYQKFSGYLSPGTQKTYSRWQKAGEKQQSRLIYSDLAFTFVWKNRWNMTKNLVPFPMILHCRIATVHRSVLINLLPVPFPLPVPLPYVLLKPADKVAKTCLRLIRAGRKTVRGGTKVEAIYLEHGFSSGKNTL